MSNGSEQLPRFPYPSGSVDETVYPDHKGSIYANTYLLFETELFTKEQMLDFAREYARLNK